MDWSYLRLTFGVNLALPRPGPPEHGCRAFDLFISIAPGRSVSPPGETEGVFIYTGSQPLNGYLCVAWED